MSRHSSKLLFILSRLSHTECWRDRVRPIIIPWRSGRNTPGNPIRRGKVETLISISSNTSFSKPPCLPNPPPPFGIINQCDFSQFVEHLFTHTLAFLHRRVAIGTFISNFSKIPANNRKAPSILLISGKCVNIYWWWTTKSPVPALLASPLCPAVRCSLVLCFLVVFFIYRTLGRKNWG